MLIMNNIKEAIEYRAAGARWEREEAYTLLQQSNPSAESNAAARRKIFFNDFMAGPDAITFIAVRRGKVIGTMSLFMDGNIGLPIDQIFRSEVRQLRYQWRSLAH